MFSGVKTILGKRREKNKENKKNVSRKMSKTFKDKDMEVEKPDDGIDIFCTAKPKREPLQGKLLLNPVKELSRKPPKDWEHNDLLPIVNLLAGRPYIDGRGENREGAYAFDMISSDFDSYLEKHDEVRGLIDPTYVVADVGGQQIPNFALKNYPATLPQPVNFGGANYIWVFTGRHRMTEAAHLVGWIQHAIPNLTMFKFNTTSVATQY
ncbi:hypothetical protein C1646_534823 [Rhizophagus diaphanus]|nr:hypothetical protein C1646_534823 [Rhizophagus diaphanus] [Rhizophagus sp. MUCL 43196]